MKKLIHFGLFALLIVFGTQVNIANALDEDIGPEVSQLLGPIRSNLPGNSSSADLHHAILHLDQNVSVDFAFRFHIKQRWRTIFGWVDTYNYFATVGVSATLGANCTFPEVNIYKRDISHTGLFDLGEAAFNVLFDFLKPKLEDYVKANLPKYLQSKPAGQILGCN
ncbi:MAG: hypothetical protein HQK52_23040 [Oligoflexia bacterium]|nr:hypothetical protein [Oligoflexia bacterium]